MVKKDNKSHQDNHHQSDDHLKDNQQKSHCLNTGKANINDKMKVGILPEQFIKDDRKRQIIENAFRRS